MNMTDVLKYTRSQTFDATLTAALWVGVSAPFTYTIQNAAITDYNNVEVIPGDAINADQVKALGKASIVNGVQSNGKVVLRAFGKKKPEINIPIKLIVRGGMV